MLQSINSNWGWIQVSNNCFVCISQGCRCILINFITHVVVNSTSNDLKKVGNTKKSEVDLFYFWNLNSCYNSIWSFRMPKTKRYKKSKLIFKLWYLFRFQILSWYGLFLVSLTNTKKKGLGGKQQLVEGVREAVEKYSHIYLFSVQNMRNNKLKFIRNEWKDSRFGCCMSQRHFTFI